MSSVVIGISKDSIVAATGVPEFRLGTVGGYDDPASGYQEFIYGRASGAITAIGYVCVEATGFDFLMATTTTTAPGQQGPGSRVGVAQAALADNQFGWFQIYGKASVRTLALAAKGTKLNTTATDGALDDDATAGAETIDGLVLGTATGAVAATNADAMLSYPCVGRTL
jgi:hypothetical protein